MGELNDRREPGSRRLRTLLFVPGDDERKLAKLATVQADGFIVDFEDGVAPERRTLAADLAARTLPSLADRGYAVLRVNSSPAEYRAELQTVAAAPYDCVMLPKVESASDLDELDSFLSELEAERPSDRGRIEIIALVESARGICAVDSIALAAGQRLKTLALGPGDLEADLRIEPGEDGQEILYSRSRLVVAARAAGLESPIDGPFVDLDDDGGLAADSERSRRLGFQGRQLIHPRQIEIVSQAFHTLSADETLEMREIVEGFEKLQGEGVGSARVNGVFVDAPVYERMKQILEADDA